MRAAMYDARALTEKIKAAGDDRWDLIAQAYRSGAWEALGYPTWVKYCQVELADTHRRLPPPRRQKITRSMREAGMSLRAIGAALGVDHSTLAKEIRAAGEKSPARVRGVRGGRLGSRAPLPSQFHQATVALDRAVARLQRLSGDDRLRVNRAAIAELCAPELRRAAHVLGDLMEKLEITA